MRRRAAGVRASAASESATMRAGSTLAVLAAMAGLFDAVDRLQGAMTFHRERQNVLAGNLANLDTPGYRPLDLERTPAGDPGTLATTDPAHLQPGAAPDGTRSFDDGGALVGPDGNAVSLERELAKIDANRVRYSTSADLVSRRMALLKYAAGDGNG
jgi:flagellar basal-body rod protein FlgB